jgi:DNA polymerase III subunit epsilon
MYLFFDTETTGLPKNWKAPVNDLTNWPRLVQLAFLCFDGNGNKISGGDFIIKPEGFTIPSDASLIHGISTERALRDGEKLSDVLQHFQSLINQSDVLVAHNMSFDEKIVGAEFLRIGMQNSISSKRKICTMISTTTFCAIDGPYGYKWPKLSELHFKLFGENFEEAHNAAVDIHITAKCFWKLVEAKVIKNILPKKEKEPPLPVAELNYSNKNDEIALSNETIKDNIDKNDFVTPYTKGRENSIYGLESVFNEAFCLINNKNLKNSKRNFCFSIHNDPDFLKKGEFTYIANSNSDYLRAIELFTVLILKVPMTKYAILFRGIAFEKTYNNKAALSDYSRFIELDPDYADAYYYRGKLYGDMRKNDLAKKDLDRAILLNPENSEYYHERAIIRSNNNDVDAIADFNKAIEIDQNNIRAYNNRGAAYSALDKKEKAEQDFNTAIFLCDQQLKKKKNENLYYYRGWAKNKIGLEQEAINDFTKSINMNPFQTNSYYSRGLVYRSLKNYEMAISDCNIILDIDKEDAYTFALRGFLRESIKDVQGAKDDYSKAIEINPEFAIVYYKRGRLLKRMNLYENAMDDFIRAAELDPQKREFQEEIESLKKQLSQNMNDAKLVLNSNIKSKNQLDEEEFNKEQELIQKIDDLSYLLYLPDSSQNDDIDFWGDYHDYLGSMGEEIY